jgi:hypothetical protein
MIAIILFVGGLVAGALAAVGYRVSWKLTKFNPLWATGVGLGVGMLSTGLVLENSPHLHVYRLFFQAEWYWKLLCVGVFILGQEVTWWELVGHDLFVARVNGQHPPRTMSLFVVMNVMAAVFLAGRVLSG